MKTREESVALLHRYIENENLRHHCRMVAAAMEAYAGSLGKTQEEADRWWTAGLLHDLDWEKYPDEHPARALKVILPEAGYPSDIIAAVAAPAAQTDPALRYPRGPRQTDHTRSGEGKMQK